MIKTKRDFKIGTSLYQHGKKGIWYCRFKTAGREIRRSTGKLDAKLARDVAWQIFLDESGVRSEKTVPLLRSTFAQIKDLLKLYEDNIAKRSRCSTKSARANSFCLKRMLRLACNDFEAQGRLDTIAPALVHVWREKRYAEVGLVFGEASNLRLNYSLNSDFRQAKSVFSRQALALYAEAGIKLPECIRKFKEVPFLESMNTRFVPIPEKLDLAMKEQARSAICGSGDKLSPAAAVVFELARFCGLTAKEISAVRWSWFESGPDGNVRLGIFYRDEGGRQFFTKRNKKNGVVNLSLERFESWKKALVFSKEKAAAALFENVEKTLSETRAWMNGFLPDREKNLHEARKMAGSDILTRTGSISAAAKFLRDDPSTVERYYAADLSELPAL